MLRVLRRVPFPGTRGLPTVTLSSRNSHGLLLRFPESTCRGMLGVVQPAHRRTMAKKAGRSETCSEADGNCCQVLFITIVALTWVDLIHSLHTAKAFVFIVSPTGKGKVEASSNSNGSPDSDNFDVDSYSGMMKARVPTLFTKATGGKLSQSFAGCSGVLAS